MKTSRANAAYTYVYHLWECLLSCKDTYVVKHAHDLHPFTVGQALNFVGLVDTTSEPLK
jgi:hypothetical protein